MAALYEYKGRRYHQVQSLRDVTRSNFPNGQIRFSWSIPAGESWNPSLSFFTIRHELNGYTKRGRASAGALAGADQNVLVNGNSLSMVDQLAPNMFLNDSLWQQLEFKINGITVNKQDNYVHQIAALKHRLLPEDKNSTWGKLNFHQSKLDERSGLLASDGVSYDSKFSSGYIDLFNYLDNANATAAYTAANAGATSTITLVGATTGNLGISIGDILTIDIPAIPVRARGPITALTDLTIAFTTDVQVAARNANAILEGEYKFATRCVKPLGRDIENLTSFETIWKPKLGIFDINEWLPGGEYEIVLTPFSSNQYKKSAIESTNENLLDVNYEILNIEFILCGSTDSGSIKGIQFYECRCQAKTINTASLSQKQFVINPKTKALTVAYQDNRVQASYAIPAGKFKIADSDEKYNDYDLKLTRFFIQYDGSILPNPIPDIRVNRYDIEGPNNASPNEDYISQRYWESQYYKMAIYENIESIEEWKERGPYYHFAWPRQNKGAMEVQVSQEFKDPLPTGVAVSVRPQLLLFEHYPCSYKFETHLGFITGVKKIQ